MKNKGLIRKFRQNNYLNAGILIVFSFTLLAVSECYSKRVKNISPKQQYLFNLQLESCPIYDNNILVYSDKYKELFKQGFDEDRFHIKTFDDLFFKNSFKASIETEFLKKLPTQLTTQLTYYSYINNPIKNWFYANLGLKQKLTQKAEIKLGYSVIPHYYVRNYLDTEFIDLPGDLNEPFKPFEYSKDNFYSWFQYDIFEQTSVQLNLSYSRYFHNQFYTDYNSKNYQIGLKVNHNFTNNFNLGIAGNLLTSKAINTSNGINPSYDGEGLNLDANWKLPEIFNYKSTFGMEFEFSNNLYRSNLSPWQDPFHAGRKDKMMKLDINYDFFFNKNLSLSLNYFWSQRRSGSVNIINNNYLSDEKDFDQHRFGLTLLYKIQFK